MSDATTLVNKLWSYCNVLRDDGLSYGDYLEQLTYLLSEVLPKQPLVTSGVGVLLAAFGLWQALRAKSALAWVMSRVSPVTIRTVAPRPRAVRSACSMRSIVGIRSR